MYTEQLRQYIVNEPVYVQKVRSSIVRNKIMHPNTAPPTAINRGITNNKKNEIYVDVFEKVSVVFNSSGFTLN